MKKYTLGFELGPPASGAGILSLDPQT
jgi:hypothetical protein